MGVLKGKWLEVRETSIFLLMEVADCHWAAFQNSIRMNYLLIAISWQWWNAASLYRTFQFVSLLLKWLLILRSRYHVIYNRNGKIQWDVQFEPKHLLGEIHNNCVNQLIIHSSHLHFPHFSLGLTQNWRIFSLTSLPGVRLRLCC